MILPLAVALDSRTRAVSEDAAIEAGHHGVWLRDLGALFSPHANADADADAYANANANKIPKTLPGGEHMKPGLYLIATPSGGSVAVLRAGWIRRVEGDEYEIVGSRTPLRGDYSVTFDQAQRSPPKSWRWTEPSAIPCPIHRIHIHHPYPLDPVGYAELCPRPKDWAEE